VQYSGFLMPVVLRQSVPEVLTDFCGPFAQEHSNSGDGTQQGRGRMPAHLGIPFCCDCSRAGWVASWLHSAYKCFECNVPTAQAQTAQCTGTLCRGPSALKCLELLHEEEDRAFLALLCLSACLTSNHTLLSCVAQNSNESTETAVLYRTLLLLAEVKPLWILYN